MSMERAKFKERMKALKAYKDKTGKGYWDWKVQAFDGGGDVEQIGEKEIQWFKDWYNKRMEYAIANNRPDIAKQLESLQYYFYPEPYKYSLEVPWDNSIYTGALEPKINRTKISINDQAIKDYEKEHGVKIGGYQHPAEGIVLPSNYSSSDLLHELAHIFNSSESVTTAVNTAISDENGFVSFSKGLQNPEYWISPWEVHSRLMQFRKENSIDPTKVYNEEDVKQLRKSAKDEMLFEIFDDSQMMHLLNDVAYNETTSTDDRLFLKNGGVVPAYGDGTGGNDEEVVEERPRMTPNPNIMGNAVKFWYGNRLKQKQYSDQVGDVKKFYDLFDNSSRLTPEKFYEVHKGRPWNIPDKHASDYYKAQDMAGGAIPNKGVWSVFSASGPQGRVGTMYHEGVGHIMGDLTPGIQQVETPTLSNPYPDIYDYAGYINQTNEKFAETWAFRAMNWNMKDANGNYYIDPNRQLTEEEIQEMIDNGAEIPKQWQKATPFEISYMHNTFAENDSKTDDYVFAAKDGGMVPAYGDGTDGDDEKTVTYYSNKELGMPFPARIHDDQGGHKTSSDFRWDVFDKYDPAAGVVMAGIGSWFGLHNDGEKEGEEDQYYKAYLGLPNAVPPMKKGAQTNWDAQIEAQKEANGELLSDFYGTTPRMDSNIQALSDTLMLGKISRDYDSYKKEYGETLPSKSKIEKAYEFAKKLLNNPNQWHQADYDEIRIKNNPEISETLEGNPLGMLAKAGVLWDDKNGFIYVHDTYDFNKTLQGLSDVPVRPREMKIRSRIKFDPKKGSKLLRDGKKGYVEDYPEVIK